MKWQTVLGVLAIAIALAEIAYFVWTWGDY